MNEILQMIQCTLDLLGILVQIMEQAVIEWIDVLEMKLEDIPELVQINN